MGLIENGTVTGIIPEKRVFAVNYPGYPTSIERAVETLGGEDGISKERSSESNYLELRFRPEDPFSHPMFGELHAMSGLLLQVSGVQKKENTSQELRAEIVARVDHSYDFVGMADYQYVLPVHAELARERKRRRLGQHHEQGGLLDMEQDEMMILPPPLFSLKDMPEDLVLRPSEVVRASQKQGVLAEQSWEMDIIPCFNLDFKIKEIPPKINWEEKLNKDSADWHLQAAISKLFDERTIWSKATMNDCLVAQGICLTDVQLRRFLFRTAYYFGYGPFRTLWIRNGYDPRKDPESRIHQMIDFRIPKPVREAAHAYLRGKEQQEVGITWSGICSFKVAPLKQFSYLQLYDLDDEYIRSQIGRPPERSTCSENTGWFRRSTIERLRQYIRVRFLGLIPGNVARDLEQKEARKLELLKRLDTIASNQPRNTSTSDKDLSDKETEVIFPTSDTAGTNLHKDDLNTMNYEDEEEEEEEEEEEDEDEEVEDQQLQGGGLQNNLQSANKYMESFGSIPKNYLQELLKKFPLNTCDDVRTTGNIDLSDEDAEYTFYEQDDEDEDEI